EQEGWRCGSALGVTLLRPCPALCRASASTQLRWRQKAWMAGLDPRLSGSAKSVVTDGFGAIQDTPWQSSARPPTSLLAPKFVWLEDVDGRDKPGRGGFFAAGSVQKAPKIRKRTAEARARPRRGANP